MRNIEYQQLPNGELSYKLFSESGQLQQSGTTTQEYADAGLFGANTSDNYTVSYAEPIERVGTGLSTEVSAGSVRPGSTSIGEQPVQAAAAQAVEPQDDVVRRSDEGPSGGYPQFVQDNRPRAADIGRADPQTFESPIATEYDSFDMDSFAGDALARFRGVQEEQVRPPEQIAESEDLAQRRADRDPGSLWYSDDPGSPMRNQDFNYAGLTRPEDNPRNTTNPDQSMLIDTFGKNIGAQGVSSLGDMSSNDMQRMLNRGTISQGSISDVEQRIGDIQANTPPASAPVQLDDMGVEVNSIIDVLGTGNVLDPGTSGLASAGQAASGNLNDFGVRDNFNKGMMSESRNIFEAMAPGFGQAMQPQASLPQGGLGSLSQPIAPLQQFNISGSYNAPPIKSPFV